ncbi:uncharacterized protein B0H64DRAFT_37020 [Chaetomium fimeti]|uniref:Uncharacterized protein n=1 Tax=Chaetomium fimeti TaxID=1854472 RepID=A0AAE0HRU3_9PEZI|nr:hypothetical protein B0H64DRAFT_37020 [Chaetomium fimeti]
MCAAQRSENPRTCPHRGVPLSAPVRTWFSRHICEALVVLGFQLHFSIVASCAPASSNLQGCTTPQSEPAELQPWELPPFLLPRRAAHTPSHCAFAYLVPDRDTKTVAKSRTYRTVPVPRPPPRPCRPCAFFWDCILCISLHAADDAPVISHSGLPGTLLHLQ